METIHRIETPEYDRTEYLQDRERTSKIRFMPHRRIPIPENETVEFGKDYGLAFAVRFSGTDGFEEEIRLVRCVRMPDPERPREYLVMGKAYKGKTAYVFTLVMGDGANGLVPLYPIRPIRHER